MRIIDSHFHWWPRSVSERFCKRAAYPRAEVNSKGGYTYMRQKRADYELSSWAEWFDLDKQLEHMDGLGHQVDVVCSIGPFSVFFSELPPEEGIPGQSALAISLPLLWAVGGFLSAISVGTQAMTARRFGAGDATVPLPSSVVPLMSP